MRAAPLRSNSWQPRLSGLRTGPGTAYPLPLFMAQVREALHIASERVRAKFGFACSQAMDQLAQIEHTAARFDTQPDAQVEVLAFHE